MPLSTPIFGLNVNPNKCRELLKAIPTLDMAKSQHFPVRRMKGLARILKSFIISSFSLVGKYVQNGETSHCTQRLQGISSLYFYLLQHIGWPCLRCSLIMVYTPVNELCKSEHHNSSILHSSPSFLTELTRYPRIVINPNAQPVVENLPWLALCWI